LWRAERWHNRFPLRRLSWYGPAGWDTRCAQTRFVKYFDFIDITYELVPSEF
jgi:hypothetical protein